MKTYTIWKNGKLIESPYSGRYAGIATVKIFRRLSYKSGMRAKKEN